jgi:hypothetical protein
MKPCRSGLLVRRCAAHYHSGQSYRFQDLRRMSQNPAPAAEPVLDPVSRLSEILFGLIMTLTFTGTFSVASAGSESVRQLLIAAVGCNLAWGLTDAIIYLIRSLCERGHSRLLLHRLQALPVKDHRAHAEMVAALPPAMRKLLTPDEIDQLHQRLQHIRPSRGHLWPNGDEWRGALAVFLLVSVVTLPVVLPFIFVADAWLALRMSNAIALLMMFLIGYRLARYAGSPRAWLTGAVFTLFGAGLVSVIIALGG